jgi:hypothetical protein
MRTFTLFMLFSFYFTAYGAAPFFPMPDPNAVEVDNPQESTGNPDWKVEIERATELGNKLDLIKKPVIIRMRYDIDYDEKQKFMLTVHSSVVINLTDHLVKNDSNKATIVFPNTIGIVRIDFQGIDDYENLKDSKFKSKVKYEANEYTKDKFFSGVPGHLSVLDRLQDEANIDLSLNYHPNHLYVFRGYDLKLIPAEGQEFFLDNATTAKRKSDLILQLFKIHAKANEYSSVPYFEYRIRDLDKIRRDRLRVQDAP